MVRAERSRSDVRSISSFRSIDLARIHHHHHGGPRVGGNEQCHGTHGAYMLRQREKERERERRKREGDREKQERGRERERGSRDRRARVGECVPNVGGWMYIYMYMYVHTAGEFIGTV